MIEKILYDFLVSAQDTPVYTEIPGDVSTPYYTIEKTGSKIENHIQTSTVAIQSHGDTLFEVISMNEALKELMLYSLPNEDSIGGVRLNTDYNFTNPQTKEHRYQAIFVITHY